MKKVLSFRQFESKAQEDLVFYAVVLNETDELLAFFDEIDFADQFIMEEILSSNAYEKIEDQLRSEGKSEEWEDWEEEVEVRVHELTWEIYDIRALDMDELIDYLRPLDERRREWVFKISDSEHVSKDKIEKIIRGKGMFGV